MSLEYFILLNYLWHFNQPSAGINKKKAEIVIKLSIHISSQNKLEALISLVLVEITNSKFNRSSPVEMPFP